jgi:hypothetical protein
MQNLKIRLYTTYYEEKDIARKSEYLLALKMNIENKAIGEINILIETGVARPFKSSKVNYVDILKRPTFQDFINLSNLNDDNESVNVISNTDIYFNNSIELAKYVKKGQLFSLNRWNLEKGDKISFFAKYSTGDTWIYKGKFGIQGLDYNLGQLGCDNRFLHDVKRFGYSVSNPSLSILSFHVHFSMVRGEMSNITINNRIEPPYLYSIPSFLMEKGSKGIVSKNLRFVSKLKLFLIRRNIKFQYYYDIKNNLILHEHEIQGVKSFSVLNYWLHHDCKFSHEKLNLFNIDELN